MKWYHSLITKITLIFALAILGIGSMFFIISHKDRDDEIKNIEFYAKGVMRSAFDRQTRSLDFKKIKEAGFEIVIDEDLKELIISKTKPRGEHPNRRMGIGARMEVIGHKANIYVALKSPNDILVLKSPFEHEIKTQVIFFIIAMGFVILLYIAIIKSIIPLYDLRKKIKEFADGNYDIECPSKKKDEIAVLANEFNESVKKIKKLREARQLFLRNIMHELKTPITKGKLSCELIEESNYKKTLQKVFVRQESLLEEFARIEKLNANELNIKKEKYNLLDIIDYSLDILNYEKENLTCNVTSVIIEADFELFGTAIKNLLDNGIKYSNDLHVKIENDEKSITIINNGEALEFELSKYAEPYFLKGKKQKSSRGLGFGLYIVWHIIKLHDMNIEYTRKDEKNIFKVIF